MRARMPAAPEPLVPICLGLLCLSTIGGCLAPWRTKDAAEEQQRLEGMLKAPEPPELVRQATAPSGLRHGKLQSFGLINGLHGTGGTEPPSMYRDLLLAEMKTHNVENPNQFIDSPSTALVMVSAIIPPGVRRGDRLDLIVKTSDRTETTSLKGGWLMPARLSFTQIIGGVPRTSDTRATGIGPVVVRGAYEAGDDPQLLLEGRIINGGVAQKDGHLSLRIRPEYEHVLISKGLEDAINRRFFFFDGTRKRGIATAKEDDLIDIDVHPRYRHNVHRMMAVVGAIGTETELSKTHDRIAALSRQLAEPTTAGDAAMQLEAIGEEAIPSLLVALGSTNPEIRFYAAEALAYLDSVEAVDVLVELSRDQPAFRYHTLQALSGMKKRRAADGLRSLLDDSSTETRCGAFDAIRRRADCDIILSGTPIDNAAKVYRVPSAGGPLVSLSLRRSPDIVIFAGPIPVTPPEYLICGTGIMIVGSGDGQLQISRFLPGEEDQQIIVPPTVESLCRGIASVGGGYGDMIEALRMAKQEGYLTAQLAVDVLPQPLREYHRQAESSEGFDADPASLPPQRIDPPAEVEPERGWYDPRGWFSAIDLSSPATVS